MSMRQFATEARWFPELMTSPSGRIRATAPPLAGIRPPFRIARSSTAYEWIFQAGA
jgi:hypothetical protein